MSLVLTQAGGLVMWQQCLNIVQFGNPTFHLFGQSYSPTHTDVWTTWISKELPLANGYAPVTLPNTLGEWSFSPNSQGQTATATLITFNFTGALTVFGYFVSWDGPQVGWFAEQFAAGFVFPAAGGPFNFLLVLPLISIP